MAIAQAMCNSFKQELLVGTHNFTASSGDSFKLSLHTSSATLNKSTNWMRFGPTIKDLETLIHRTIMVARYLGSSFLMFLKL